MSRKSWSPDISTNYVGFAASFGHETAVLFTAIHDPFRAYSSHAMDIAVHWGVLRHLRRQVNANSIVLLTAIALELVVLATFLVLKAKSDMTIVIVAVVSIVIVFVAEAYYLRTRSRLELAPEETHLM